ncbi:MAG: metal ABC transporter permease [Armatimonadota bacterium]
MFEVFQSSFMQFGLIASALIGTACGYLSVYVVLKRLVFLAVALAQLASAAVAVSLFLHVNPTLAALVGVLLGALLFSWPGLGRYLPRENAIGASYALASAVGVLLIAKNAQGETHLLNLLYGNVLTVEPRDLWLMGGVTLLVGIVHLRFAKEFLFTSFDAEMAQTVGVRPRFWETLFYISLGLVISMAIHLGGMMLVFALLVLPGFAALLARCRIRQAFPWAIITAIIAGAAGLYLSFIWDLPTSAVTVAGLGVFTALAVGIGAIRQGKARTTSS